MLRAVSCLLLALASGPALAQTPWVSQDRSPAAFALFQGTAPTIVISEGDDKVVAIAAKDLARDLQQVTGKRADVLHRPRHARSPVILIGTLGKSGVIDALAKSGRLDVKALRGAWESFVVTTVKQPMPGVAEALVIVGSDRRGTAFGVYELSQAIGVSPWYWWSDVVPEKKRALYVKAGTRRFGPPSVKYRGIFINDEDWGLQAWAARTLEPENGGIGPKTYARVFELMLRLKANILWPAMHPGTPAFNSTARNALLADDYAIVMGSSHAEPMLRNNVSEWKDGAQAYNYLSNPDGVRRYWEERLATNARFENFYTVGMRGIHDSRMVGPSTDPERVALLEKIIADQRDMLAQHTGTGADRVPQLFCAYKEVLGLYRMGLMVPDDVTIMLPDDNFGYIRGFPNEEERKRAGGFGIYYHLSYLGAPLSYLWLSTIPPALIWAEMSKAYEQGARQIWIANVGDIKPAEINTEFFLQMAWDSKRWTRESMPSFLGEWARREFGPQQAGEIASIMAEFYRLNHERKPEHLQWWLPKQAPKHSGWPAARSSARLEAFARLSSHLEALGADMAPARRSAFFQLVAYPVRAAALANQRFFEGERGNRTAAMAADAGIEQLNEYWNGQLAGGKWRHMMPGEPNDSQWRSMRSAKWSMPAYAPTVPAAQPAIIRIEAEHFSSARDAGAAGWRKIAGLGQGEGSVSVFPTTAARLGVNAAVTSAPRVDYRFEAPAGRVMLRFHLVPTHAISGGALRLAIGMDDSPAVLVEMEVKDGGPEWAQGVLDGGRTVSTDLLLAASGGHTLQVYGIDPGVAIDRIEIIRAD
ncbi:MAG: glycosyl hydrolase 115 family protein [Pseudomonadota bacterium]